MLPFNVSLGPGIPIYEQVVQAVKRAIANGQLRTGDAMPSVRELSRELSINPNTAQKVMAALIQERLVSVVPGIGSVVADRPVPSLHQVDEVLGEKLHTLIVDAAMLGVSESEFLKRCAKYWKGIIKGKK